MIDLRLLLQRRRRDRKSRAGPKGNMGPNWAEYVRDTLFGVRFCCYYICLVFCSCVSSPCVCLCVRWFVWLLMWCFCRSFLSVLVLCHVSMLYAHTYTYNRCPLPPCRSVCASICVALASELLQSCGGGVHMVHCIRMISPLFIASAYIGG